MHIHYTVIQFKRMLCTNVKTFSLLSLTPYVFPFFLPFFVPFNMNKTFYTYVYTLYYIFKVSLKK